MSLSQINIYDYGLWNTHTPSFFLSFCSHLFLSSTPKPLEKNHLQICISLSIHPGDKHILEDYYPQVDAL